MEAGETLASEAQRTESGQRPGTVWYVLLLAAFVFQAALLVIVGVRNRQLVDWDGICYIRVASYYLHGRLDLAVTGYWGPLLSWTMAPLLPLFHDPLGAARVAMGLSGILFLAGCVSVFRAFRLSRPAILLGT